MASIAVDSGQYRRRHPGMPLGGVVDRGNCAGACIPAVGFHFRCCPLMGDYGLNSAGGWKSVEVNSGWNSKLKDSRIFPRAY